MPVKVSCPNPLCGKSASVSDENLGQPLRCPFCRTKFTAPAPSDVAPPNATFAHEPAPPTHAVAPGDAFSPPAADPVSTAMSERIGRFQVRAVLGAGTFGTVYRAYDPQLEREVALKVPRRSGVENPHHLERFMREAKSAAKLRHPHIVPVFETGFDGTHHYIASAFIEGRTLADAVQCGPMPPRQAVPLVRALAEALAHAHENGIVHRDVKPGNVLLDSAREPYLTDFGLAHRQDAVPLTRLGSFLGTPGYMAPELARGTTGECNPACDQYSLGVLLYELLCGRKPFEGPAEIVLFHAVESAPPLPRQLNPSVPAGLEAICLKAMAKQSQDRFAGCRQLAEALGHWLEGPAEPPAPSAAALPSRASPRWQLRSVVASAATGAGLIMVVIALIKMSGREPPDPEPSAASSAPVIDADPQKPAADSAGEVDKQERGRRVARLVAGGRVDLEYGRFDQAQEKLAEAERLDPAAAGLAEFRAELRQSLDRQRDKVITAYKAAMNAGDAAMMEADKRWRSSLAGEENPAVKHYRDAVEKFDVANTILLDGAGFLTRVPEGARWLTAARMARDDAQARLVDAGTRWLERFANEGVFGKNPKPYEAQPEPVTCAALSGDGKWLASGSHATVTIWDVVARREKMILRGHVGAVSGVAFSRDGRYIVSAGEGDRAMKVWDVVTGVEELNLSTGALVRSVSINHDGTFIAAGCADGSGPMLRMWQARTGKEMFTIAGHSRVSGLSFSGDGKYLVATTTKGNKRAARVWDTATGAEKQAFGDKKKIPLDEHVVAAAFSGNGDRLVLGYNDSRGTIKMWDLATGQMKWVIEKHGKRISEFVGLRWRIEELAFSPDGKRIAARLVLDNGDRESRWLKLWDADNGKEVFGYGGSYEFAFSGDIRHFVWAGSDGTLTIWDAHSEQRRLDLYHRAPATSVTFLNNRQIGARVAGQVKLWDALTGQLEAVRSHAYPNDVVFSADGQSLAGGDWDGNTRCVSVWNLYPTNASARRRFPGHTAGILSLAFSPRGERLASASADETVRVWDIAEKNIKFILHGHMGNVWSVAFSRDGKLIASGGADRTVRVWDAVTGKEKLKLRGHTGVVWSVAFSGTGKEVVSASGDGTVCVWDVATGEKRNLEGHVGPVYGVAVSPDNRLIVSASADRTLKLWDRATGRKMFTLRGHTGAVFSVAFSPDGNQIVSGSSDGTVRIWEAKQPIPLARPGQPVLRYHFKKGDKLQYILNHNVTRIAGTNESKVELTSHEIDDVSWIVKDVDREGMAAVTVKYEHVRWSRPPKGYLGITLEDAEGGVKVTGVVVGGPAAAAGIKADDVVTQMNSEEVAEAAALISAIGRHKPGTEITLKITRGETKLDIKVGLSMPPPAEAAADAFDSKKAVPTRGLDTLLPMLKAKAALEYDITIDALGRISTVKLSEQAQATIKQLPDGSQAEYFSPVYLQHNLAWAMPVLPAEAAKPGTTWKNVWPSRTGVGRAKVEQTLEYRSDRQHRAEAVAEIGLRPTLFPNHNSTGSLKLKEQQAQGTLLFDAGAGRVLEASLAQTVILVNTSDERNTTEIRQIMSAKLQ